MKLLIADDTRDVAEIVAFGARMIWPECEVTLAASGREALDRFAAAPPDLVVLDVAMPPPDGFEVCRRIREESPVPILMLTVRDAAVDKVRALDIGADDYLTKPFDHLELLARMKALVRRAGISGISGSLVPTSEPLQPTSGPPAPAREVFTFDCFALDTVAREVRVSGEPVALTRTEYRLLVELVRHAGEALSHRHLLERVWGPQYADDTHYLKVFMQRLRRKLGDDPQHPRYIHTEWGVGYRFSTGA